MRLPLALDFGHMLGHYAEQVHEQTRRVVRETGPKRFADLAGLKTVQQLDNAIMARERHHMRFEIPLLAALLDPSDGMAKAFMDPIGRGYDPRPVLTPEEQLKALNEALDQFGALGELVREKAGVR